MSSSPEIHGFSPGGFQYGVFRISVRIPNLAMAKMSPRESAAIRKKQAEFSYGIVFFLPKPIIFLPSPKMIDFSNQDGTFSYACKIFLHNKLNILPLNTISYLIYAFSYTSMLFSELAITYIPT